MSDLIDITVRLSPDMATWPGSPGVRLDRSLSLVNGDEANVTRLDMDVHSGTHIETALHMIEGGEPAESVPLEVLIGPAWVSHLRDIDEIGPDALQGAGIPDRCQRLLLRTRNSSYWNTDPQRFRPDYAALTQDGAEWLVERGVRLVGVDYLSVQAYGGDPETHRILMRANVAILEGINLADVEPGLHRLICLPLWLAGAEAAPARAILEPAT